MTRQKDHQNRKPQSSRFLKLQRPRILRSGQKSRSLQKLSFDSRHFKLGLRADGLSLLPSALRPGLLGIIVAVGVFGVSSLVGDDVSAASLTLSVPSSNLSLEIEPNNQFKKSSESSITAKTDALAGYTLKIKSKSEANSLVNSDTSVKLNSLSTKVSEADYQNDGNTNTWGYKPKKFESVENSDFLPGPTAEESIIDQTSAKNDSENSYSITLGAKVDTTLPTGIYTNTFVFLAAANSFSYTITYDLQGGSDGPSPTTQTKSTVDATVKLDSAAPNKTNYEFQGWCSTTPTSNNTTSPSCSGTTYQPGGDYTFVDANSSSLTLWAIWKQTGITDSNCPGVTITKCSLNGYNGERYNGGKCWMNENRWLIYSVSEAKSKCTNGWHLPSNSEAIELVSVVGTGNCLYSRGWGSGYYTTSNSVSGSNFYQFYVGSGSAETPPYNWSNGLGNGNDYARCVSP